MMKLWADGFRAGDEAAAGVPADVKLERKKNGVVSGQA
jgi:hypothetical protein